MLGDKSLLEITIGHALASRWVSRTFVSTDSDTIMAVALQARADVVRRPAVISNDFSPSEAALKHVLENAKSSPDIVVMLQCTSPFRAPDDIDNAIRMVAEDGYDSVLSVVAQNQFVWNDHGKGAWSVNYDPVQGQRPMRQSVKSYVENGSIYVFKPWVLEHFGSRLGGKIGVYEMNRWQSVEVDTEDDLELCKWILETGRG
jgi:N-acylneuraminate cytidylyltransferase